MARARSEAEAAVDLPPPCSLSSLPFTLLWQSQHNKVVIPWEMIEHVYSFCDAETLAMLSLVSFGSWQTAGPLLYETISVTSLDMLKPLFFLVRAASYCQS